MSVSAQTALHFLLNFIGDMLGAKSIEDARAERPRALTRNELVETEEELQRTLHTVRRERESVPRWYRQDCCECGRYTEYLVSDADIHPMSGPFGDLPPVCYQCWSLIRHAQGHVEMTNRWQGLTRYPYYEPLELHHRERLRRQSDEDGERSANFWHDDGENFWRDDEGGELPPPSAPPQSEESSP